MIFLIQRTASSEENGTSGQMFQDGKYLCFTHEDPIRPPGVKIPGNTAIPEGKYLISITYSQRFKRYMVLVNDVPLFSFIRIHSGNGNLDTEGCPLTGETQTPSAVGNSVVAYRKFWSVVIDYICDAMEHVEPMWLEVKNPKGWTNG